MHNSWIIEHSRCSYCPCIFIFLFIINEKGGIRLFIIYRGGENNLKYKCNQHQFNAGQNNNGPIVL